MIVPVITSTDGRWVAMIRCIPAARAICANRWIAASCPLTSDQHQVSHLIDHDDDQGQFAGVEGLRLKNRLAGLRIKPRLYLADQAFAFRLGFSQAGVEPVDIAYPEL